MVARSRKATAVLQRSNDELRGVLLQYFYERHKNATSARGKRGVAAKISDVKRELKQSHSLTQQQVWSHLTYLISQGWVEEEQIEKSVPLKTGTVIPQTTSFYKITAVGIDKIEGPGEFTMDKFRGIKIEATGQNIITVGDGNQVNAEYRDAAGALVDLKNKLLTANSLTEIEKLNVVADIDTIQSQLAKPEPNGTVVGTLWGGIKGAALTAGLVTDVAKIAELLAPFLS